MKRKTIGTVGGVEIYFVRNAVYGTALLWIVLAGLSLWLFGWPPLQVIIFSTFAVLLHWLATLLHQFGHAWAAAQTGYPMRAVRMWGVLSASIYPKDEPALPADTHLYRAIGGPVFSLAMSFVGLLLSFFAQPLGDTAVYLTLFFAADNFFIFCIGALLPLGFTDGSTIIKYWRLREK